MVCKSVVGIMSLAGALIMSAILSNNIFAEPTPFPIPKPKVTIAEAIELATNYFQKAQTRTIDTAQIKKEDFILVSAQYTNYFDNQFQSEWAWYIKFRHPVANDISVTYKVTNDKKIVEIQITE